jgi:hypothetical protein
VIYVFALVPTVVFAFGLFVSLKGLPRFMNDYDLSSAECRRWLVSFVTIFFFLGNLALVLGVAVKHHVWSLMQGRLLFPSYCGLLVALAVGAGAIRGETTSLVLRSAMIALVCCFSLYFASEIAYQALLHFFPVANLMLKDLSSHAHL